MAFAATAATWTGTVSTNWNSVLNWDTGVIPTSTTNVIIPVIPSLRYPVTTSVTGICHNLTVNAGARVTVGAFDLIVSGDALINGQLAQTSNTDFEVSGNITWGSGATAAISNSGAEIYCYGNMTFAVGSNVQLGMGYLEFCGVDNSCYLTNNSTATELYNVRSACTGQFLTFSASSNADIVINGSFWNYAGSRSYCYYEGNVIIKGPWLRDFNTDSIAGLRWFYGSLVMDGVSQTIDLQGPYCYLQELHINPTTSVTLDSDLELKGDLHLETGYLAAGSHQIEIGGSWNNTATADAFYEGTSTVVFTGDATQYCHDSEHFYILTVDKTAGYLTLNNSSVVVSCASYDWMQGGVEVNAGVFAANTLADNCIAGTWYLHATGYINLYAGSTGCIDLAGDLHITGGTFTVYGGAIASYWPYTRDASIEMSGGVLDFYDQGILIQNNVWAFSEDITGGRIRVALDFRAERPEFTPAGGVIEMFGTVDCFVSQTGGAWFRSLHINKTAAREGSQMPELVTYREGVSRPATRSNTVQAITDLDINGYFRIEAGVFFAPAVMRVGGNWYNSVGEAAFQEGTGLVVFDPAYVESWVYAAEVFHNLELNKTLDEHKLTVTAGNSVICDSYDWTRGKLNIAGGSFTALDLVDAGLYGPLALSAGTANFHQDSVQYLDVNTTLDISGGELHLYGGSDQSYFCYTAPVTLNMSDGLIYQHGWGIFLSSNFALTENITGGTIRVERDFRSQQATFTPLGGAVEMYGPNDGFLVMGAGELHILRIDKNPREGSDFNQRDLASWTDRLGHTHQETRANTVTVNSAVTCNGILQVYSGTFKLNHNVLTCGSNLLVYGGVFDADGGSMIYLQDGAQFLVYSGARLNLIGTATADVLLHSTTGHYTLVVQDGGTLAAAYTYFQKLAANGVYILSGATVDPDFAFTNCRFLFGVAGGALLTINNNQYLVVLNAVFSTNAGGGASNVKKTVNTGMVNFVNATGAFSGEAYDADEYYRIHWTVATASPDLQILRAAWTPSAPLPYMGDTRTLIVTVANASLNPLTTDHWLDLYFDPAIPPVEDQSGDLWQLISDLPASLPVDLTFNVSNFDPALEGVWDSYLYLDSFGAVTETVETNNIYGPFTIIWQPLPVIDDLTIEPDPDIPGNVRLDWTYDLSVTRFDIMRASDPYGTFIYLAGSAASQFSTPFAARQFYQVKAVRLPAKQAENPPRNLP